MRPPIAGCVFITSNSASVELARLQQDAVGDADLADVVESRGGTHDEDQLLVQTQLPREQLRCARDTLGVLVGVVVAILAHQRETSEALESRRLELLERAP